MKPKKEEKKKEFNELLLEVRRVTRVTTGGRRMSFRATIVVGNGKGKIGLGVSKGPDVSSAVQKATREAYKNLFFVPVSGSNTVPYKVTYKHKACRVFLSPASQGTGLKAGSSVRQVLGLAGYENVLSKIIGSNNKLNNALATIYALSSFKYADKFSNYDKNSVYKKDEKSEKIEEKDEKNNEKNNEKKDEKKSKKTVKKDIKKTSKKETDKKTEKKDSKTSKKEDNKKDTKKTEEKKK